MSWNYSDLSHEAKEAGGPEAFKNSLIQTGRNEMMACQEDDKTNGAEMVIAVCAIGQIVGLVAIGILEMIKLKKVNKNLEQEYEDENHRSNLYSEQNKY